MKQIALRSTPPLVTPELLLVSFLYALFALPIFFSTLRAALFQVIPFDNYAPILLWMLGHQSDSEPLAPFVYRFLSYIPAALFLDLPLIGFSRLTEDGSLLANGGQSAVALQAIVLWSILCVIGAATLTFQLVRQSGTDALSGFLAGLVVLGISPYLSLTGVDGPFLLALLLVATVTERPALLIIALLLGVIINEKIPIALGALCLGRCLLGREYLKFYFWRFTTCVLVLGGYFCLSKVVAFHSTTQPLALLSQPHLIQDQLSLLPSGRGVVLILIPGAIAISIPVLAWYLSRRVEPQIRESLPRIFRAAPTDPLVPVALASIAIVANTQFNIGRIMLMSFVLFIPALVTALFFSGRSSGKHQA